MSSLASSSLYTVYFLCALNTFLSFRLNITYLILAELNFCVIILKVFLLLIFPPSLNETKVV